MRPGRRQRAGGEAVVGDGAIELNTVRRQGDGRVGAGIDRRRGVVAAGELHVQQWRAGGVSVPRFGHPLPATGDDEGDGIAGSPAGPGDDFGDDGRQIGRALGRPGLADGVPGRRVPADRGRGPRSRGNAVARGLERRGVIGGMGIDHQRGGDAARLVRLELYPRLGDRRPLRNGQTGEADADRLVAALVVDQFEVGIASGDLAGAALLGVVVAAGNPLLQHGRLRRGGDAQQKQQEHRPARGSTRKNGTGGWGNRLHGISCICIAARRSISQDEAARDAAKEAGHCPRLPLMGVVVSSAAAYEIRPRQSYTVL